MKMRKNLHAPELVHDMIKRQMEANHYMAAAPGTDLPCQAGKGY